MTKTCPSCGFVSNSEARFCRMCGALLPRASNESGDDAVSPSASTVPLSNSRPTTGALSPHDTGSPERAHTARLRGEEMQEFLRRASEAGDAAFADDAGDETDAGGERPLTIRVRPIDTQPTETTEPPPATTPAPSSAGTRQAQSSTASVVAPSTIAPVATSTTASSVAATSSTATTTVAPSSVAAADTRSTSLSNSRAGAGRPTEARALRLWAGAAVFGVVALVVAAGVLLAWYAVHKLRGAHATETTAATSPAPVTPEAQQTAAAKLAEAEQLIAAGRADEAVARLREAAALDPANAEPHRRLARLLLEEGARRTAIEELRAVVRIDQKDADAWRDLAAAQSAEGSHADAAESYRALFGASAEASRDDRTQLLYADALRLSGRSKEAQGLYKRLAASGVAEVARASRQHLAQLAAANDNEAKNANSNVNNAREASATPTVTTNNAARDARANGEAAHTNDTSKTAAEARPSPATLPVSAASKDHYERGVGLWRTNRAAALAEFGTAAQSGNADASYYLGLNLAEGRDPRTLKRAELVGALTYFQRARRSRFATEARRYEDSLGREFDRRRAGGEP